MKLPLFYKLIRKWQRIYTAYKKLLKINFSSIFPLMTAVVIFIPLFLGTFLYRHHLWDYNATGPLGDTIGGITAPVINLVAAYLVWRSFQAQIRANRIQIKALKLERDRVTHEQQTFRINGLISQLREDVNIISYEGRLGLQGLDHYVNCIKNTTSPVNEFFSLSYTFVVTLRGLLDQIHIINNAIEKSSLPKADKDDLMQNITSQYKNKLEYPINVIVFYFDQMEEPPPSHIHTIATYIGRMQIYKVLEEFFFTNNNVRAQLGLKERILTRDYNEP